jgi:hypothetical protein
MKIEADVVKFDADIKKFAKTVNEDFNKVFRKIVFDIFARLLKNTPVDKGTARGNWNIGVNVIDYSVDEGAMNKSGSPSMGKFPSKEVFVIGSVIYITNSLPYIKALEDGHSGQAPHGFMAIVMAEVEARMLKAIK